MFIFYRDDGTIRPEIQLWVLVLGKMGGNLAL
jgi:hypothetical protein